MRDETMLGMLLDRAAGATSDFDLNPGLRPSGQTSLRPAAVLIPILLTGSGPRLLLTKRSSQLKHHPGQIAFPGGKVEADDSSVEAAAVREAQEEIGLPPEKVNILGRLPGHETVTGFAITPVLAVIKDLFRPRPDAGEVAEAFDLPLSHVLDASHYTIERREWRGLWRSYYAVPWGPYYIWGATARILRGLAQ